MKKLIAAALIIVTAFILAACGRLKQPKASAQENTPHPSRTDEIVMTTEKPEEKPEETETAPAATLEPTTTDRTETEPTATEQTATEQTATEPIETEPIKTSQQPDTEAKLIQESPQNYFLNKNNFAPDLNNVSVKPGYVRYENGKLVADCFVINGLNAIVHDITVESLSFCDANDRVIASASFGELQGVALGPNQYIVWTFSFGPETIENFSADLSILSWDCKTSYYH